jgi:hypothetical protein
MMDALLSDLRDLATRYERDSAMSALMTEAADEIERLREAVRAVRDLIAQSEGVAGLHLNGDLAPWGELLEGGRFEAWLLPLSECDSTSNRENG